MTMLPPDPLFVLQGEMTAVLCIKIDRDIVYCGTVDGNIEIWDIKICRKIDSVKNGEESCLAIHVLQDNRLVTQDKCGTVRLWSKQNGRWKTESEFSFDFFGFCQTKIIANTLVAPIKGGKIGLWQLPDGTKVTDFDVCAKENSGEVMTICAAKLVGQSALIIGLESGELILCDMLTGKALGDSLQLDEPPMAVDFDCDSSRGIIGSPSNLVTIFTLTKQLNLVVKRTVALMNEGVASICIRPDKRLVALGCWDGKIRLLSWKTFVTLAVLEVHLSTVQTVEFSSSSPYIMAAGCKEGDVSLWDIYNPKNVTKGS